MTDMGVGRNAEVDPPAEHDMPTSEPQINGVGKQMKEATSKGLGSEGHVRTRTQPSSAPFSRYQTAEHEDGEGRSRLPAGLTTADVKAPAVPGRTVHGEDERNEGCCKCVIM
jgi:hypothetical protein